MPEIVNVFVLRGDFGNAGGGNGRILGVFTDEKRAIQSAIGRGSLDCGGDGVVEEERAIQIDDKFYVLEKDMGFVDGEVLSSEHESNDILVLTIHSVLPDKKIELIKILRAFCGFSLIGAKKFIDSFPQRVRIDNKIRDRHQLVKEMKKIGVEMNVSKNRNEIATDIFFFIHDRHLWDKP